jgi:hypothetical protein
MGSVQIDGWARNRAPEELAAWRELKMGRDVVTGHRGVDRRVGEEQSSSDFASRNRDLSTVPRDVPSCLGTCGWACGDVEDCDCKIW